MAASSSLPLTHTTYRDLLDIQAQLNDLFIRKFSCEIKLKGPKSSAPQSGSEGPVTVYRKTLQDGLKVSVWKDDMTKQDTDAVVNAANESLTHGAGLAQALAEAGGPVVTHESKRHIDRNGPVQTGTIAVTSGGNLPCKQIIHAVGPQWSSDKQILCKTQLEDVIKSILRHVSKDKNIRSVALPAISSGIFSFPLDQCADIIVRTVSNFAHQVKCDHLREVRFVNHDDKTVNAMKSACEKVMGTSDQSTGVTTSIQQGSSPAQKTPSYAQMVQQDTPSSAIISINGQNLYLKTGSIEDQRTDVIVNSVSFSRDLSEGQISKAILRRAGPELQTAIYSAGVGGHYGAMLVTPGFRLASRAVFHVLVPSYSSYESQQALYDVITQCLLAAHHNNHRSISFPPLGTGALGFPKWLVASAMTAAFVNFAQSTHHKLDVFIVIYANDGYTFKSFEDQIKSSQWFQFGNRLMYTSDQRASPGNSTPQESRPALPDSSIRAPDRDEVCAIITGTSLEDVGEAETWLHESIRNPERVTIPNNHILLLGMKEHKELESAGKPNVSISEDLQDGKARLHITGFPRDTLQAAVRLELLLMDVQERCARSMEEDLYQAAVQWVYENGAGAHIYPPHANMSIEKAFISKEVPEVKVNEIQHRICFKSYTATASDETYQLHRECLLKHDYLQRPQLPGELLEVLDLSTPESRRAIDAFKRANLDIVKMEKVHNRVLAAVFQSKVDSAAKQHTKLYQCVPGPLRRLLCNAGFHRLYQDTLETKFGAGIYFKKDLKSIMEKLPEAPVQDDLVYIIEADVLTGKSTCGEEGHVAPPPLDSDEIQVYDSLVDTVKKTKTFVIFDSYQAVPRYLYTCKWRRPGGNSI